MDIAIMVIGGLITIAGGCMFLNLAYEKGALWLAGCILFAPVQLIFLLLHWDETKVSFVIQLIGMGIFAFGASVSTPATKKMIAETLSLSPSAPAAAAAPAPEPEPAYERPPAEAPPPDTRTPEQRMLGECASALGLFCSSVRGVKAQVKCLRREDEALTSKCRSALAELP